MATVNIDYVQPVKAASGKVYYYYRRDGKNWGNLPGEPGSLEFMTRYSEIHDTFGGTEGGQTNTISNLITSYLASAEYGELATSSQKNYRYYCDIIRGLLGQRPAAGLRAPHVLEMRDKLKETPGKANAMIRVISLVWKHGITRGLVTVNPADGVKKLKIGERVPWPDAALEKVLKEAIPEIRWAITVGLYTGQRTGDCLKMTWQDYDGQSIRVMPEKDRKKGKLWIPCHKALRAVLDNEIEKRSVCILTTPTGRVWKGSTFRDTMIRERKRLEIPAEYKFHGLRKNAAKALMEAGATIEQGMAVTGHRSPEMFAYYAAQRDQKRMAGDAVKLWEADKE